MKVKSLSRVQLSTTPWTVAHQAPLSMGFSRQEYWSGLPLPSLYGILLLLLLSRFSHVQLCATPQTAAQQAPPSLGFSRQEHWSGLPFPSPMLLSIKSRHFSIAHKACHGPTLTSFLSLFLASHSYVYNSVIILHFTSQSQVQKT